MDPTGLLASPRFAELLSWAEGQYDQVLIDSPPMLVASDATIVARVCGGLMLVVQPQKNHRRLVVRAVEEIRAMGLNLGGIILNRLPNEQGTAYYGDGYGYGYSYGHSQPTAEADVSRSDADQVATPRPPDALNNQSPSAPRAA
jgi:Mrp family chromosome partitioning ATPase